MGTAKVGFCWIPMGDEDGTRFTHASRPCLDRSQRGCCRSRTDLRHRGPRRAGTHDNPSIMLAD